MIDSSTTSTFHLPTEKSTDETVDTQGVLNDYVKNTEHQEVPRKVLSGRDIENAASPESESKINLFEEDPLDPNFHRDVEVESVTTAHETISSPAKSSHEMQLFEMVEGMSLEARIVYINAITNYLARLRQQEIAAQSQPLTKKDVALAS